MGSHIFEFWGVRHWFFIFTVSKRTRMFALQMKSKVFFIQNDGLPLTRTSKYQGSFRFSRIRFRFLQWDRWDKSNATWYFKR